MARQTSYSAFAYCFPSDHQAEGFLIVGPYPRKLELVTPLIRGYGRRWYVHSLLLLDMAVDGKRLEVHPTVDARQIMVVDSGTDDTFVSSAVFYALAEAVTSAMGDRGYYREYGSEKVCFRPAAAGCEPVNWRGLPAVEVQFLTPLLIGCSTSSLLIGCAWRSSLTPLACEMFGFLGIGRSDRSG
jgi:hypothetical protein